MKNIFFVKQSDSEQWTAPHHVCIAGNYTLERFLAELQKEMDTKNQKPHSHYLWKASGELWSDDDRLLEECDRWHLSRYEVCTTPPDSKYQAIVMLYYQPALEMATLAVSPKERAA